MANFLFAFFALKVVIVFHNFLLGKVMSLFIQDTFREAVEKGLDRPEWQVSREQQMTAILGYLIEAEKRGGDEAVSPEYMQAIKEVFNAVHPENVVFLVDNIYACFEKMVNAGYADNNDHHMDIEDILETVTHPDYNNELNLCLHRLAMIYEVEHDKFKRARSGGDYDPQECG